MIIRLILVILLITGVIAAISWYLSPEDLVDCGQPQGTGDCRKADAVVVVSGGDTIGRTDEAIKLYKDSWADYIIFSGAAADKDGPSNAEVMRRHALDAGVPDVATVVEEDSETTKQNAEQVKQYLDEKGAKDIILVTSGYHLRRASLEFTSQISDDLSIRRHASSTDRQWGPLWWLTPWGWWLALGELGKIGAFYVGGTR